MAAIVVLAVIAIIVLTVLESILECLLQNRSVSRNQRILNKINKDFEEKRK
ncbi:hypothetical protein [Leptospira jelokensis]|uniref:hypothetical protein n=1 Tax=Leptospira jelokensis TaxID=2484931 RepID=UPI00142D67F0|nr:hypothetical protein [Leptospira jelokensis]